MSYHIRLLSMSKRFLSAARELSARGGQGWGFPVPHYLAGHALELALKSHLAHRGMDEEAVVDFGHRLNATLDAADAEVRDLLTEEQRAAIRWFHPFYAGKELEYPPEDSVGRVFSIPEASYIMDAAAAIVDHLDPIYRAEVRASTRPSTQER